MEIERTLPIAFRFPDLHLLQHLRKSYTPILYFRSSNANAPFGNTDSLCESLALDCFHPSIHHPLTHRHILPSTSPHKLRRPLRYAQKRTMSTLHLLRPNLPTLCPHIRNNPLLVWQRQRIVFRAHQVTRRNIEISGVGEW